MEIRHDTCLAQSEPKQLVTVSYSGVDSELGQKGGWELRAESCDRIESHRPASEKVGGESREGTACANTDVKASS